MGHALGVLAVIFVGILVIFGFALVNNTGVPRIGFQVSPSSTPAGQVTFSGTAPARASIPRIDPRDIPAGFTAADLSPYFQKVRIDWAMPGYGSSPSRISVSAYGLKEGERVDVTGWLLKGGSGSQYLPQAVNRYDPSGFSPDSDIYLSNWDQLTLYGAPSAVGRNLRLNKCIGYLDIARQFNPSLPMSCAAPQDAWSLTDVSASCRNYMQGLAGCQLPAANPPIPLNDYRCREYLNNWNYAGCFAKHQADPDFQSREIWAWTGYGRQFFDPVHDRILLLDRAGKLVAERSY